LIGPILSLDLVSEFYGKQDGRKRHNDQNQPSEDQNEQLNLPVVPLTFETHNLYMESWIPLFLYETYN